MVGSLFSWKSLLTKRMTSDDCTQGKRRQHRHGQGYGICSWRTFPTAASPSRTSLTLLLGLGAAAAPESAMAVDGVCLREIGQGLWGWMELAEIGGCGCAQHRR